MIFDILSSRVNVSKWGDRSGSISLSFDVVPNGREYLDIGKDYILCASGYLPMRDKKRTPIDASVTITSDPQQISHVHSEKPFIGFATFSPTRQQEFDPQAAKLWITIAIEPGRFNELLNLRIAGSAIATLNVDIEGLNFGWEPDGSHQIWPPNDKARPELDRLLVTGFWINLETFWTHEQAIDETRDHRQNLMIAQSRDEDDRKMVAVLSEKQPDASVNLLKQCRSLLILLFVLGVIALIRIQ